MFKKLDVGIVLGACIICSIITSIVTSKATTVAVAKTQTNEYLASNLTNDVKAQVVKYLKGDGQAVMSDITRENLTDSAMEKVSTAVEELIIEKLENGDIEVAPEAIKEEIMSTLYAYTDTIVDAAEGGKKYTLSTTEMNALAKQLSTMISTESYNNGKNNTNTSSVSKDSYEAMVTQIEREIRTVQGQMLTEGQIKQLVSEKIADMNLQNVKAPQKGVDYYTDSDKKDIENTVYDKIRDKLEDGNITISGAGIDESDLNGYAKNVSLSDNVLKIDTQGGSTTTIKIPDVNFDAKYNNGTLTFVLKR